MSALFATCTTANGQSDNLDLTVQVRGGDEDLGQVIVSLFSSSENFLNEPVSEQNKPIDGKGSAIITFRGLIGGMYGVSVIYDEDNDGELNTGLFGIPTEKAGFSNDAKAVFGPPSFRKAAFELLSPTTIVINLDSAKK